MARSTLAAHISANYLVTLWFTLHDRPMSSSLPMSEIRILGGVDFWRESVEAVRAVITKKPATTFADSFISMMNNL